MVIFSTYFRHAYSLHNYYNKSVRYGKGKGDKVQYKSNTVYGEADRKVYVFEQKIIR